MGELISIILHAHEHLSKESTWLEILLYITKKTMMSEIDTKILNPKDIRKGMILHRPFSFGISHTGVVYDVNPIPEESIIIHVNGDNKNISTIKMETLDKFMDIHDYDKLSYDENYEGDYIAKNAYKYYTKLNGESYDYDGLYKNCHTFAYTCINETMGILKTDKVRAKIYSLLSEVIGNLRVVNEVDVIDIEYKKYIDETPDNIRLAKFYTFKKCIGELDFSLDNIKYATESMLDSLEMAVILTMEIIFHSTNEHEFINKLEAKIKSCVESEDRADMLKIQSVR